MTDDAVFDQLLARGFTQAEVHFSGGHDEGHVSSIVLAAADGTTTSLSPHVPWRGGQAKPVDTPDEALARLLMQPVYREYGTFAGEFYVSGSVVYDAVQRTQQMPVEVEYVDWEEDNE